MRAIWSGSLGFGLVNIPIKLYSATSGHELSFHFLHKKDLSPIRYAKICRKEEREVSYEEIVRGFEYEKGNYVVMNEEDFEKANITENKSIEIASFVKEQEIDPLLFEKPYYIEADQGAMKPYSLLFKALKQSKRVGIAKFVLRAKEHLCAIKADDNIMILEMMRFQEELRTPENLKTIDEKTKVTKKEIDLALQLIDQLTDTFHPETFKDTYTEDLKEIIQEKLEGKTPSQKGKAPQPVKVKNLMDMLRQSIEKEQTPR